MKTPFIKKNNPKMPRPVALGIFFLTFSAGTLLGAEAEKPAAPNYCVECHEDIARESKGSIHTQQGISCRDCHGGDPAQEDAELAKAPETGFIGKPNKQQIAEKCGGCHSDVEKMNFYGIPTDQLARYKTSHHGKKLLGEGDTGVAVCSDCHGSHNVVAVTDPTSPVYPLNLPNTCNRCHGDEKLMSGRDIPTDILHKYESSVHGRALFEKKDLSVAQCASCHGSHGAMPPGVKDVSTTCGKCHVNERKYFLESVHAEIQKQGKFNECISCHSNHDIHKPSPALYAEACVKCHEPGSAEFHQGQKIADSIQKANTNLAEAEALVKQASIEGIFVEDEEVILERVRSSVVSMAPLQHTLNAKKISEVYGAADEGVREIKSGIQQKREARLSRKRALVPIWIFIFIMSLAFMAKYKELMKKRKDQK